MVISTVIYIDESLEDAMENKITGWLVNHGRQVIWALAFVILIAGIILLALVDWRIAAGGLLILWSQKMGEMI